MKHSFTDTLILEFDAAIRTLFAPKTPSRPSPADEFAASVINQQQTRELIGNMRVNHTGEVCAQALYQGQALTARTFDVQESMSQAAHEEIDHLAWCEQRLDNLGGRTSYLNPLWYTGSFVLGALAGWMGDEVSLGFVAETERQVVKHLEHHLQGTDTSDLQTQAILKQMIEDESQHAASAQNAGATPLPAPIPNLMTYAAKVMTTTAFYI